MPEITYHRRGLSGLYYIFSATFVALGVLFLMVALGSALEAHQSWWNTTGFLVAGLSWMLGAPQMWIMAMGYRKNVVRLDAVGFTLHTVGGQDLSFPFHEVEKVSWNPGLRSRMCTVETHTEVFRFDTRSCPRPGRVAQLIAERAGKTLVVTK